MKYALGSFNFIRISLIFDINERGGKPQFWCFHHHYYSPNTPPTPSVNRLGLEFGTGGYTCVWFELHSKFCFIFPNVCSLVVSGKRCRDVRVDGEATGLCYACHTHTPSTPPTHTSATSASDQVHVGNWKPALWKWMGGWDPLLCFSKAL